MAITRGTTPSITYHFNTINVSDIAVAYMTIRQEAVLVDKDLSEAVVDIEENSLTWTLTQEETLLIKCLSVKVDIQCRYRLADGKAGASKITSVSADNVLKNGVI